MPILDVQVVLSDDDQLAENLAAALSDAVGEIFGTPAGQTWVRVHALPLQNYAEDGGGPPEGVQPVFVTVLKAKHPPVEELQREVVALTKAVARVCNRSAENVHVFYEPKGVGRVAFGGKLLSDG